MYRPPHFRQDDPEALARLIAERPFATLVTSGPGGIQASHLPLVYKPAAQGASEGNSQGVLRGHLAKPNPQAKTLLEEGEVEALAIFQGPQAYVSPSWYPSKQEHGKVVPTWNYVVVHAYGSASAFTEPARLLELVERLTDKHERSFEQPWAVADAPADFTQKMLNGIVGIEIAVTRLEGAWKLSQNKSAEDREGVARGLRTAGAAGDAESAALGDLVSGGGE